MPGKWRGMNVENVSVNDSILSYEDIGRNIYMM